VALIFGAVLLIYIAAAFGINLNPAVGVDAWLISVILTKSCCVSRVRGVAASATDGPEGKLGGSREDSPPALQARQLLCIFCQPAQKNGDSANAFAPEAPSRVNSLR